jgi:hypothetical protein
MRLTFLGTTSNNGNCPTLYLTDRDTYVVQGYLITDQGALDQLRDLNPGETAVEIPRALLGFAPPGALPQTGGLPSPDGAELVTGAATGEDSA